MSDITLTMQMNENNPDSWCTFAWRRNRDGMGGWYTTSHIGNTPPHCLVHTGLSRTLTSLAMARGMAECFGFAKTKPKPKKTPRVRGSSRKNKATGLLGGFNPFSMG
jgi:hypothetical protein